MPEEILCSSSSVKLQIWMLVILVAKTRGTDTPHARRNSMLHI